MIADADCSEIKYSLYFIQNFATSVAKFLFLTLLLTHDVIITLVLRADGFG